MVDAFDDDDSGDDDSDRRILLEGARHTRLAPSSNVLSWGDARHNSFCHIPVAVCSSTAPRAKPFEHEFDQRSRLHSISIQYRAGVIAVKAIDDSVVKPSACSCFV